MTKDWDSVQEEIKQLSFSQKKPLGEVKELMERKYKFRASTRAYRMKLKEWGLMRHKPRRTTEDRSDDARETSECSAGGNNLHGSNPSTTAEPMSVESTSGEHCTETDRWQVLADSSTLIAGESIAEPTFMGLLSQSQDLQPTFDPWPQGVTRVSEIVLDMLGAILDNQVSELEQLVLQNTDHINDPIGMPFDTPNSRFFDHPVMRQIVILQHPDQTLFDIACGMPCGPVIWVLLAYGAKGSKHPHGTDLALHNAVKNGRAYTVQALVQPGRSDVNGLPGSTWKPLFQAVFWNVPEVVRILLSRGAKIDDCCPSPYNTDTHTALQLCLEHRENVYEDTSARERCNQILEMLLSAGSDVHVKLTEPMVQSTFDMFIKPWQTRPHWSLELSSIELDCLRLFMSKQASLQASFQGSPCGSAQSKTFMHQALWHSTPAVARFLVDNFVSSSTNDGLTMLHEIIGSCPGAKRHPADTLRDIDVLLEKGVDPNGLENDGISPLRKCIEQCPAVDLVARLQMILHGGADPEPEDSCGVQPYLIAARTFEEPLLSEVMSALVAKIKGRYVRQVDGVTHAWAAGHFPISETQTYEQVVACTQKTGDFQVNMRNMMPDDVQSVFARAYFSVASKNFLDMMTRVARTKMLETKEKDEIIWIVSMREGVDLPQYEFNQRLVIALLDPQPIPNMMLEPRTDAVTTSTTTSNAKSGTASSPASSATLTVGMTPPAAPPPTHAPFQFNSNPTTTTSPVPSQSPQGFDDFFVASTTQIRWLDPCAKPKHDDAKKALAAVLMYKCGACGDEKLLTKKELERHEIEHDHTGDCDIEGCLRRFCVARRNRKSVGCQDHLFLGGM
ncbi:ankyrin [Decorospora gaudefroyi]|uniref:Ankyrin n=1 Tax=Decorospora gaudefroyi TaxID=184978 RepID=A0A6A5K3J8_9PLEO|nr:ankyrin [Decorospora gaudefroyi]